MVNSHTTQKLKIDSFLKPYNSVSQLTGREIVFDES